MILSLGFGQVEDHFRHPKRKCTPTTLLVINSLNQISLSLSVCTNTPQVKEVRQDMRREREELAKQHLEQVVTLEGTLEERNEEVGCCVRESVCYCMWERQVRTLHVIKCLLSLHPSLPSIPPLSLLPPSLPSSSPLHRYM